LTRHSAVRRRRHRLRSHRKEPGRDTARSRRPAGLSRCQAPRPDRKPRRVLDRTPRTSAGDQMPHQSPSPPRCGGHKVVRASCTGGRRRYRYTGRSAGRGRGARGALHIGLARVAPRRAEESTAAAPTVVEDAREQVDRQARGPGSKQLRHQARACSSRSQRGDGGSGRSSVSAGRREELARSVVQLAREGPARGLDLHQAPGETLERW